MRVASLSLTDLRARSGLLSPTAAAVSRPLEGDNGIADTIELIIVCPLHTSFLAQRSRSGGTALMITTDELRLVCAEELEKGRFSLSLPSSPEDWEHRRAAALNVIKQKSNIPDVLLNLVLVQLKELTPVKLMLRRTVEGFMAEVEVVDVKINYPSDMGSMAWELENVKPASEVLAWLLRIELRALKYAERRSSAKVRSSPHLIPRSTISDIALDLLERSEWRYPPGDQLVDLFRELLNLENPKQQYPRELEAQEKAANILAHNPQIGVGELAKAVGVNKSSVSRWMKRPDFQDRVKRESTHKLALTWSPNGLWHVGDISRNFFETLSRPQLKAF